MQGDLLVFVGVASLSMACRTAPQSREASTLADASSAEPPSNPFDIPAQTIVIQHDRPDLHLARLSMAFFCLPDEGGNGGVELDTCGELSIEGRRTESLIEFPATGDRIDTKRISFRFSKPEGNTFCVGMKVFFQEIPNEYDATLYIDSEDRYSILSYCTKTALPPHHADQPRWTHRREATLQEFLRRLAQPILLALEPKQ